MSERNSGFAFLRRRYPAVVRWYFMLRFHRVTSGERSFRGSTPTVPAGRTPGAPAGAVRQGPLGLWVVAARGERIEPWHAGRGHVPVVMPS